MPQTHWPKTTHVYYLTEGQESRRRLTASQHRVPGRNQSVTRAEGSAGARALSQAHSRCGQNARGQLHVPYGRSLCSRGLVCGTLPARVSLERSSCPRLPGGPCVGGSFQVTVVSRDGELPEPRWLMPMTVCQSCPGMKTACGDQCGQTSCSPSPRGSFRGPRGPHRVHGNVSSRGGTALRLLCGRGFRGSEARGERWAGRGAVICSVLICTQGSRPPTSRGRLCVFVLFASHFLRWKRRVRERSASRAK